MQSVVPLPDRVKRRSLGELGALTTIINSSLSGSHPSEDNWPRENVVNIPDRPCTSDGGATEAGNVILCTPRSIAVATCEACSNELIIADTGSRRRLVIESPIAGAADKNGTVHEVLDDTYWDDPFRVGAENFYPLAALAAPGPTLIGTYDIFSCQRLRIIASEKNG